MAAGTPGSPEGKELARGADEPKAQAFEYQQIMGSHQILVLPFNAAKGLWSPEESRGQPGHPPPLRVCNEFPLRIAAELARYHHWSTAGPPQIAQAMGAGDKDLSNALALALRGSESGGQESDALAKLARAFGARFVIRSDVRHSQTA